jgi:lysophospholipase L1-like esterase
MRWNAASCTATTEFGCPIILTIATGIALVAASISALAQQPGPIVMLGDSITEGAPSRELTGCDNLVNRGIGGDTTAKILARLDEVLKLRPRAVFLMIGVNDISLVPKETTVSNLTAILERLKGTHVVATYVLPVAASLANRQINSGISALNDAIAGLITGRPDTTVLDLRPLLRGGDGYLREEFSYDGIHLTPKGYAVWRDAIAPYVVEYCKP